MYEASVTEHGKVEVSTWAGRAEQHNQHLGSPVHCFVQRCVQLLLFVLPALARLLFDIRIEGGRHLREAGQRRVIVGRHFYEWDAVLGFYVLTWPCFLAGGGPVMALGGRFWGASIPMRVASYLYGVLWLVRGQGADQTAFRRAEALLGHPEGQGVLAFFPTGPVGDAEDYEIRRGAGYLARRLDDVPFVPATPLGVRDFTLADVLLLRRPTITFRFAPAFRPRDLGAENLHEAMARHLRTTWDALEARP